MIDQDALIQMVIGFCVGTLALFFFTTEKGSKIGEKIIDALFEKLPDYVNKKKGQLEETLNETPFLRLLIVYFFLGMMFDAFILVLGAFIFLSPIVLIAYSLLYEPWVIAGIIQVFFVKVIAEIITLLIKKYKKEAKVNA